MHSQQIRSELKQKLFPRRGPRRSIDLEVNQFQCKESFSDYYLLLEKIGIILIETGEGAHSVVRKCQKMKSKTQPIYAVKCYRTHDPEIVNTIIRTFNLQRQLSEIPQVCKVYDLFIDEKTKHHYEVIEYCHLPSLDQVQGVLSLREKQMIIKQLATTIAAVHSKGICHRDLKPDNILLSISPLEIKLIDFGVCKRFKLRDTFREMWTATGTILYQAPEVFLGGGYDEKIDVWSIGVILYQLLCGSLPFYADTVSETIEQITTRDPIFQNKTEFQTLEPMERDLIKRLLKYNPDQRLNAACIPFYHLEIPLHPWLSVENMVDSSLDDIAIRQEDLLIEERTMSNQTQFQISEQQVQNLKDSFEWGSRIHFQN